MAKFDNMLHGGGGGGGGGGVVQSVIFQQQLSLMVYLTKEK